MASHIRLLTIEDVQDIIHMKGSMLDILAATVQRATEIFEAPPPPVAKKTKKQLKRKRAAGRTKPSKKRNATPTLPPPPLPEAFATAIQDLGGGGDARLVIQKFLFATDVAPNNNRFSIPVSRVVEEFLREEEKRHVGGKRYLEVKIIAPSLAKEAVKLTRWDMAKGKGAKTSSCYVINGAWNRIVEENGLEEGMEVQLWSFRVHQDLWFALVNLS